MRLSVVLILMALICLLVFALAVCPVVIALSCFLKSLNQNDEPDRHHEHSGSFLIGPSGSKVRDYSAP
jgi:uncharacterized membrane protein